MVEFGEQSPISYKDAAIICLAAVANALGIPRDEAGIKKVWLKEEVNDKATFIKAAKKVALKATAMTVELQELSELAAPVVAVTKNGSLVVIGQNNHHKIVVFEPMSKTARIISVEEFKVLWAGEIILVRQTFSIKDLSRQFNLTWFIPVFIRYKRYFIEIIMAAFFFQLFGLAIPLCTQVIIDKVIINNGIATLTVLGLGLILAAIFQAGMNLIKTYLFTHTTNKIDVILGTRMFRHLLRLPVRFFEIRRVGDTLVRVGALNNIREFLTGKAMTALLDLLFSSVFFVVMFIYSIPLTLVALAAIPIHFLINMIGTPNYEKRLQRSWNASAENNAFVVEAITGIHTVKSLAVEPQLSDKWERLLAKSVTTNLERAQFSIILGNSASFVQKLTSLAIIWLSGTMVIYGEFTVGQFIAFQMLASQVSSPLLRLVGMWQSFQQTKLAISRIGDIINAVPEPVAPPDTVVPPRIKGDILLDNITFRYIVDGNPVLNQINLHIKSGMKVGIVGRSGSGKSTLAKMIQRLYIPDTGKIYIDGLDIAKLDPAWLRRQVGVVQQENYLFNGSIKDNIAIARQGTSMEDIIKAAQIAGAHEFILELPEGYDTIVGERGSALSGGQQQRIAIARALLNDPRLVIFDEATSALDYHSERIIMRNIDQIAQGRTMLIIAHRLSTVRKCEFILVMDHGSLVEQGTHQELMNQKGLYYHLYQQQGAYHA